MTYTVVTSTNIILSFPRFKNLRAAKLKNWVYYIFFRGKIWSWILQYFSALVWFIWKSIVIFVLFSRELGSFSVTVQHKSALGASLLRFIDGTQLDTHLPLRSPLNQWSSRRKFRSQRNTQHTQETKIHTLSGIRTHDPRSQSAAD